MAKLNATELVKIPPSERDEYYTYLDRCPYTGKPELQEILMLKERIDIWGRDSLGNDRSAGQCSRCSSNNTMWRREGWIVCFDCLAIFDVEEALDFQYFLEEEAENEERERLLRW